MQIQIFTILAVVVVTAQGFSDCGSTATISSIVATASELTIQATPASPVTALVYTVKATVLGAPIILAEGNACETLDNNGACIFSTTPIPLSTSPLLSQLGGVISVQIVVEDQNGTIIVCANVPITS